METPRLYVGTYAKYNNGSIYGGWLDLDDYTDAEEFIAACKELHEDESDPEFMFQDFEGFPRSLYSESMGESEIEKIYEHIEILQKIDNWDDSDWICAHNTYCLESNGSPDDQIHEFDEEFFNTYFDSPMSAARATCFGDVTWSHQYITFDGYGNLKSLYSIESEIDKEAIIADIIENPSYYNV